MLKRDYQFTCTIYRKMKCSTNFFKGTSASLHGLWRINKPGVRLIVIPVDAGGGHAIKYYRFDRALSVSVRTQCNYISAIYLLQIYIQKFKTVLQILDVMHPKE